MEALFELLFGGILGRLGLPLALLVSFRAGEAGSAADRFARLEQLAADVVCAAPLSLAAARDLLAGAFGQSPDERFGDACHAVTGGNPFLLGELAASLGADGIGPGPVAADRVAGLGPRSVAPGSCWTAIVGGGYSAELDSGQGPVYPPRNPGQG